MNRKQLQLEVCKALLNPDCRVFAQKLNDNEYAITTTGYDVVVFDEKEIIFDVSKIRETDVFKNILVEADNDEELKKLPLLYKDSSRTVAKCKAESFEIYFYTNVAKKFDGYTLYANSEHGRILAKDRLGRIVGAFLPIVFHKERYEV